MSTPVRPKLSPLDCELLIERAAIMEFDGNMPRDEAERRAWQDHSNRKNAELVHALHMVHREVS